MSPSWESKRWKTIHNYMIQISLILSFHLCKQKQHTKQEKIKSQIIIKHTTKIINYTHRITELVPEVKFAYADVSSNLKICLHEQREDKCMFPFSNIDNLHNIFRKFDQPLPNNDVSDDDNV